MAAAIGLLLGGVQFLVWFSLRSRREFLFAGIMSIAAGVTALGEAAFLGNPSPEEIQFWLEIQNVAIGTLLISMVWYVRERLKSGRIWMAWMITAIWTAAIVVSIASPGNLTFLIVDSVIIKSTFWGETYGTASGTLHPMKIVADLASLAITIFVADAAYSAYRAGERRDALRTGGAILFFIVLAGIHTPLVDAGIVQTPFIISLAFVAICFSLALDLIDDVIRSAQLSASLLKERQRWNALTQNVDLAVIRVDKDGLIAYVNPFLEKISLRSSEQLIGRSFLDLVSEDSEEDVRDLTSATTNWVGQARVKRQLRAAGGGNREIIWFSAALRTEDGNPDGFISFGQDVTEQIRTEAANKEIRREIERLTRAVALGELSSSLAHELSQPVAAILSNTQTLQILRERSGNPTNETDEILQDIYYDSRRAKELMQRVRGFMIDKSPETERFDLAEAAGEVVSMVAQEAQKSNARIEVSGGAAEFWVKAARLEIQQVLMNLLLNAVQAIGSTDMPGRIVVSWSQNTTADAEITVEDSGPGLSTERLEAIFEPFFTTKTTGTGIGLAVSRRIIERHNGSISAGESDLGGARFSVILPIVEQVT